MLFKLLGLPFSVPAAGLKFVFNTLVETAEAEMTDDGPVKEALLELQLQLEEGEIAEDEYAAREAVLFQRLREIRAYRDARVQEQLAALRAQQGLDEDADDRPRVVIETNLGEDA